jgi:hypothetical protein
MSKLLSFLILLTLLILFSCKKEEATQFTTSWAAPVAYGEFGLTDFFSGDVLYANSNGVWNLQIMRDLAGFGLDTLLAIPDTTISRKFVVPLTGGPFNVPPNANIINQTENTVIGMSGVGLREVLLYSGKLKYKVKSYVGASLQCIYTIDGLTNAGSPTVLTIDTQPESALGPDIQTGEVDLSGLRLDLSGVSGLEYNKLVSHVLIKTSPNATSSQPIYGQDSVRIELTFEDPIVEYARGYFGSGIYGINQLVTFAEDAQLPQGIFQLESASMNLEVNHKIGMDAIISFTDLTASRTSTGNSIQLIGPGIYDPLYLTRAIDFQGNVVGSTHTINLNEGNSNLTSFMSILPNQFHIQGQIQTNPFGNVSDGNDFYYRNAFTEAKLRVDIPLSFAANNLELSDTIFFDLEAGSVVPTEIVVKFENQFPIQVEVSLIDALGIEYVNGAVISANSASEWVVPISTEQWNQLVTDDWMLLRFKLNTSNYPAFIQLSEGEKLKVFIRSNFNLNAEVQ